MNSLSCFILAITKRLNPKFEILQASGKTYSMTWIIENFAAASCPKVFGATLIAADQVDLGSFNFSYRYENQQKVKRRRRSVSRFVDPFNLEDSFLFLSSSHDMMVDVF